MNTLFIIINVRQAPGRIKWVIKSVEPFVYLNGGSGKPANKQTILHTQDMTRELRQSRNRECTYPCSLEIFQISIQGCAETLSICNAPKDISNITDYFLLNKSMNNKKLYREGTAHWKRICGTGVKHKRNCRQSSNVPFYAFYVRSRQRFRPKQPNGLPPIHLDVRKKPIIWIGGKKVCGQGWDPTNVVPRPLPRQLCYYGNLSEVFSVLPDWHRYAAGCPGVRPDILP